MVLATIALAPALTSTAYALDEPDQTSPLRAKAFRDPDLYIGNIFRRPGELPTQAAATAQNALTDLGIAQDSSRLDVRGGRFGTLMPAYPLVPGRGVGNNLDWYDLGAQPPASERAYRGEDGDNDIFNTVNCSGGIVSDDTKTSASPSPPRP